MQPAVITFSDTGLHYRLIALLISIFTTLPMKEPAASFIFNPAVFK
jgi:hypothetical protein